MGAGSTFAALLLALSAAAAASGKGNRVVGPEFLDQHCLERAGPDGQPRRCCPAAALEGFDEYDSAVPPGALRCLPSFVVVGAQKAGTTALAGYLALHPNVSLARKKEVHFFDTPRRDRVDKYVTYFPAEAPAAVAHAVSGEASPSYMSFPGLCANLTRLLPHARLVAILRDPVDRAWSEYHMKQRRLSNLDGMLALLREHATRVRSCVALDTVPKIEQCLPEAIREHPLMSRLTPLLRRVVKDPKKRAQFNSRCFKDAGAFRETCLRELKVKGLFEKEPPPPLEAFKAEARRFRACLRKRSLAAELPLNETMRRCSGARRGISKGYLWRGMYAPQLQWCANASSSLLVLDSEQLRREPQAVMDRVAAHLGVPPMDVGSAEQLALTLESNFSSLVKTTGWQLRGDYPPIPADVEAWLAEFYAPVNEELFEWLGERFSWRTSAGGGSGGAGGAGSSLWASSSVWEGLGESSEEEDQESGDSEEPGGEGEEPGGEEPGGEEAGGDEL